MLLKKDATDEKLRGSYYTPKELAKYIVKWATEGMENGNILEPSCGDGVFLQCIEELNLMNLVDITAIEIDEEASIAASKKIKKSNRFENYEDFILNKKKFNDNKFEICNIINEDFYNVYENRLKECKFKAIIGIINSMLEYCIHSISSRSLFPNSVYIKTTVKEAA